MKRFSQHEGLYFKLLYLTPSECSQAFNVLFPNYPRSAELLLKWSWHAEVVHRMQCSQSKSKFSVRIKFDQQIEIGFTTLLTFPCRQQSLLSFAQLFPSLDCSGCTWLVRDT